MKLRRDWQIRLVAFFAAWLLRLWVATLRYLERPDGNDVNPHRVRRGERYLYAFWHEHLLVPACQYSRRNTCALASKHADGRLIAAVLRLLGARPVLGSSTRGGFEATRELLRACQGNHLVLTPDGPRGPRRRVQLGIAFLAAHSGLPIIPVGFGFDRPWRLRSWDRLAVPRPFSRAVCITGEPIHVPGDASRTELEAYRLQIEQALNELTERAEALAERRPVPTTIRPAETPQRLAG